MTEPLFGSGVPIWTGSASPGFAWTQPPAPFGSRFVGASGAPLGYQQLPFASPLVVDPLGFGGPAATTTTNQPLVGPSSTSGMAIAAPLATPLYPAFFGPEIRATVTAPALLAAVALRRGQPAGPTNDQEIEEFIYDTLDLLPGTNEIEVRSEAGRTTLTGTVQQKRLKHDAGEIAWAIPGVTDVQNNVTIVTRRRSRPAGREAEAVAAAPAARKQG